MGEATAIAWADDTFNPWVGCQRVSEGCRHCYAESLMHRWRRDALWGPKGSRQRTSEANWRKPVQWNRAASMFGVVRRVFTGSLCDVFEDHPEANEARPDFWRLVHATPSLTWMLLTKRPENIAGMLPQGWGQGAPNVWLGTSIEDMRVAHRSDALREVPAVVRFVSYEPALGPLGELDLTGLHWVIYGGESGPGFRPDSVEWARQMQERCAAAGVAFFFKQRASRFPGTLDTMDGHRYQAWPDTPTAEAADATG